MDKYIGRLLDNRYEILEEIGRGGMAVVYRARCHRLNRFVAVKILKEELSMDEDFRRRFHAESQAVAMLSHPNIVAVYDVNHSNDADYIVMELIDGLTLKQYMQQRGVLSWREVLHFSSQIAKALEHAHGRGIVHRDIKPHNIMVLKDGSVKVADFGIARLSSSQNTLTREALGSVHYISPEQAKGAQVDSRSDLYSLGVVMYEMMTGKPPYDGESPVAIAIQHINSTPVPPRQLNNAIPLGLQQITLHAMSSDLATRYSSATAMIEDLEALRKNPQIVFRFNAGPGGTTTYVDSRQLSQQKTAGAAAAGGAAAVMAGQRSGAQPNPGQQRPANGNGQPRPVNGQQYAGQSQSRTANGQARPVQGQGQPRTQTAGAAQDNQDAAKQKARSMAQRSVERANAERRTSQRTPSYVNDEYDEDDDDYYDNDRRSRGPLIAILVLVLVIIAMLIAMWLMYFSNLTGGSGASTGSSLEAGSAASGETAPGESEEISPEASSETSPETSDEPSPESGTDTVPDFRGMDINDALSMQFELLTLVQGDSVYSDEYPEGQICEQSVAPETEITSITTVVLKVSKGKETVSMPNLVGLTMSSAVSQMNTLSDSVNISVRYEYEESDSVEENTVISTNPTANTELTDGTTVTIVISLGKETRTVTVPNLIGLEKEDAVALLESMNLEVSVTEAESSKDAGLVFYQSVNPETDVPEGTIIAIKVSTGHAATPTPAATATPTPTVTATPTPSATPEPSSAPTPEPETSLIPDPELP